ELSRQAGVDDVGRASSSGDDTGRRDYGLLDEGRSEDMQDDQDADDLDDDFGFDDGGDGGNGLGARAPPGGMRRAKGRRLRRPSIARTLNSPVSSFVAGAWLQSR